MRTTIVNGLFWMGLAVESALGQAAFTYQGRLFDSSKAATGTYDFQFRLTDAATNGNYIGSALSQTMVSVTNGVFTVLLDFGSVFDGSPRFLEAGVRTNGSSEDYTILQPLQPITTAPYSELANKAVTAGVASNLVAGAVLTNLTIAGSAIQAGTITAAQLDPETDAAYRSVDTNAVNSLITQALADASPNVDGDALESALSAYATTDAVSQATALAAWTNRGNTFSASQSFMGDYNRVSGAYFDFHRTNGWSPSAIRFFRDDDTNFSHHVDIGMDWALGGYYWSVYDTLIDSDIFRVGVDPPWGGLVSIGNDGLVVGRQFSIHDYLGHGITNSVEILSAQDGVIVNSWSRCADAFTIQRDGLDVRHWFRWYQGDGKHDWRVGMETNYNLAFYAGNGSPTSSTNPGVKIVNLSPAAASFGVPLVGDGSGLTNIWPSFLPTNTLAPLGGYSSWPAASTFNGWLGVCVVAGQDDMLLKALARYSPGGLTNKQHQILVLNADFTTNGCVTLPRTRKQGDFVWANCNIMVNAGTTNYIVTDTGDGDYYLEPNTPAGIDQNITGIFPCAGSPTDQTLGPGGQLRGGINFVR